MNPLFAAALELQRFFAARQWRFCFIGGLAVQRWGEPRLTLDVDCTEALEVQLIWRELIPLLESKGDADTCRGWRDW